MKVLICNGPNLNMLGIREKTVYGSESLEQIMNRTIEYGKTLGFDCSYMQSNHEGVLVDTIQQAYFDKVDGILINPAAYTHTSVAIADAISAIAPIPVIEVHLSDIDHREEFRKQSYCQAVCLNQVKGYGGNSYIVALDVLKEHFNK